MPISTEPIGPTLRRLREEQGLSLRKVASDIGVDIAVLSKMERGERRLTRSIVNRLAQVYNHDGDQLLILYLSEKVLYEIREEEFAFEALHLAESQLQYHRSTRQKS